MSKNRSIAQLGNKNACKTDAPMIRTSLYIDEQLHKDTIAAAAACGLSKNVYITRALRRALR